MCLHSEILKWNVKKLSLYLSCSPYRMPRKPIFWIFFFAMLSRRMCAVFARRMEIKLNKREKEEEANFHHDEKCYKSLALNLKRLYFVCIQCAHPRFSWHYYHFFHIKVFFFSALSHHSFPLLFSLFLLLLLCLPPLRRKENFSIILVYLRVSFGVRRNDRKRVDVRCVK